MDRQNKSRETSKEVQGAGEKLQSDSGFSRIVALGMQSSRFYRKLGRGNIKTYQQGEEKQAKKNGCPSWLLCQSKISEILAAEGELSLSGSLESGWPLPSPHPALQHSSALTHLTGGGPQEHFPRSLEGE